MATPRKLVGPLLALALLGPGSALRAEAAEGAPKPAAPAEPKRPAAEPQKAKPEARKAAQEPAKKGTPDPQNKPAAAPAKKAPEPTKGAAPEPPKKAASEASKASQPAARPGSIPEVPPGSLPALAPPDARHGQGSRKVEPAPPEPPPPVAEQPTPPVVPKKGKTSGKPETRLPPGAAKRPVDAATRRQIAGGVTDDDLRAGKDDPELSKLREAERVLFPRPLPGVSAGWSWDLPLAAPAAPEVSTSGLPLEPPSRPPAPVARDADWLRGLALPNLPVRYDDRVLKYLKFYRDSPNGRAIARVWAKKSGRYQAALRASLAQAGLPTDLVWLSLIESGHNPLIVSPAGAAGLWQFMPDTARTYGLTVDRWVDERLDPERSTQAAVRFLADLYRRFGSWDLAMAAYNMGHGGLARSVKKFNTNDFWELARHEAGVPWETALYVPKILATAILMNNKKSFGLDGTEPDPAESFDVVEVGPGRSLAELARTLGVEVNALERLNPAYLAGRTPPVPAGRASPSHRLRLPRGTKVPPGRIVVAEEHDDLTTYVVRQGDTAATIARRSGASEATLRSLNRIGSQEVLAAGTVLLVPRTVANSPGETAAREDDEVVVIARAVDPPADCTRVFYSVLSGDSLASVAASFGVSAGELVAWNALDGSARLQEGMVLQVFPKSSRDLSNVRVMKEGSVRVLLAGSPGFFDYFEGLNGRRRLIVGVKQGDTLASIGKRYDMSVGWMERINRRSRTDRLAAGETVVVYADRSKYPQPVLTPKTVPLPAPIVAASMTTFDQVAAPAPAAKTAPRKPATRALP